MEESLRVLGLGDQEARCLSALYRLGEATATDIANEAAASHGTIYDLLAKLERRGLVRTVPGKTKHFTPTGTDTLQELVHERQKQLTIVTNELAQIKQQYAARTKPLVTFAEGKANFSRIISELTHANTRDYTIRPVFDNAARYREGTLRSIKRGADVRSFAGPKANLTSLAEFKRSGLPVLPIPTDNVVLLVNDTEVVITALQRNTTILIRDKDVADTIGWLFKQAWMHTDQTNSAHATSVPAKGIRR